MKIVTIVLILTGAVSCNRPAQAQSDKAEAVQYQNEAHRLVAESVAQTGSYAQLKALVDATCIFTIKTATGKKFQFEERYIFEGEKSWSRSLERPDNHVETIQGFDGDSTWLIINGKLVTDPEKLKNVRHARKTSFYLFAMNQKLLDPGLNYRYVRNDTVGAQTYDVVEITFAAGIGDVQDTFQLYINQETRLIDQVLMTVRAFGITEPELVRREHEAFGPVMIPTRQRYTQSNWQGAVLDDQWTEEVFSDIQFNQSVSIERPGPE